MFDKVLSMPPVLNSPEFWACLWFWICQSFEYTRVLHIPLVLNMPGLWVYQSSEYVRVTQDWEYAWLIPEYAWLCLDMSEYAWICRYMREYAYICLNGFCFAFDHFSICFTIPFLLEHVLIYLSVYRRPDVIVWRNMILFLWREKICFLSIAAGSI